MTEIYIVKQIDNSRLKKEIDYERTKECLFLLSLGLFGLLILLFLAWQHFRMIQFGYEGEVMKKQVSHLAEVNRQLKLERATLRNPQRIDVIAKTKLGFRAPSFDQIVVLSEPFPMEAVGTMVARSNKVSSDPAMAKVHGIH